MDDVGKVDVNDGEDHAQPGDDNYLTFTLPTIDAHAADLEGHPAWPWVCVDVVGGEVVVDYTALSMG